ncbi:MAG: hypothetical protein LBF38_09120 [Deltaproteobacteria bacterium]|nr:hypothetical protein [Deltaproteobacteria bacterium]
MLTDAKNTPLKENAAPRKSDEFCFREHVSPESFSRGDWPPNHNHPGHKAPRERAVFLNALNNRPKRLAPPLANLYGDPPSIIASDIFSPKAKPPTLNRQWILLDHLL